MNPAEFVSEMQVPFSMAVASKRNTGKTHLISQVIQELLKQGRVYICFVMSNTFHMNGDYGFLPDSCKSGFDPLKLQALMDSQGAVPRDRRKQVLVVIDDVLGDRSAENDATIMKFYAQSRHANISIVLMSQIANRILSPAVLQNSDYILYSRLNRMQLGNLFEAITNMDKQEFVRFSEHVNRDYNFVCVDQTVHSRDPAEFLKILKAESLSRGVDK